MRKINIFLLLVAAIMIISPAIYCEELKTISADELAQKISNSKNKALIVDFFATWCPPCQAEIPGFVQLNNDYKDKGVEIIGVSVDNGGSAVVNDFIKEKGINYTVFLAAPDIGSKYKIRGIPDTHIYAPGGKLYKRHLGYTSKEEFEKQINELLK